VTRLFIALCFGIAAGGEVNAFRRFVFGQIEDGAPADRVGLLCGLGVQRRGAGTEGGGSGCWT